MRPEGQGQAPARHPRASCCSPYAAPLVMEASCTPQACAPVARCTTMPSRSPPQRLRMCQSVDQSFQAALLAFESVPPAPRGLSPGPAARPAGRQPVARWHGGAGPGRRGVGAGGLLGAAESRWREGARWHGTPPRGLQPPQQEQTRAALGRLPGPARTPRPSNVGAAPRRQTHNYRLDPAVYPLQTLKSRLWPFPEQARRLALPKICPEV